MKDWSKYPNFDRSEFICKCGCGQEEMDEEFLEKLQNIRVEAGFPFIINSGYRCPDHNDRVSGTGRNGPHTTGMAVDIGVMGANAHHLTVIGILHGMTGIGVCQRGPWDKRFIHLDFIVDHNKRPWMWSY